MLTKIPDLASDILASVSATTQKWGAAAFPYWGELTPEEQQGKWEAHLEDLYGPECLEPACPCCHDAKFVHPLKPNGKGDYRKVIVCQHCYSWTPEDRQRRLEQAGIPTERQDETFDTLKPVPGFDDAYSAAWALAKGDSAWKILLLYGDHGNGKTHLARATMTEWYDHNRGYVIKCETVSRWLGSLKSLMGTDAGPDVEIDKVMKSDFLVLDELGTEHGRSEWQAEVLERVINYRYDRKLPTVLTMNGDIKDLSPAILDRLSDRSVCRMVLNKAKSYRRTKGGA